jgi:glycerophosphoryl diester phosphodiesterase
VPIRSRLFSLALGVAVIGTVAVVQAPAGVAGTGCVAPPVAHRGDSERAPENTLPAYRKALQLGVKRLEVDVRFTANDVPVLMHDRTVGRTTNGHGQVAAMALSELRALDAGSWFSREFAGVKVPTLYQVLKYGSSRGARFLVELKTRPTPRQMSVLLSRFRWLGMEDRIRVTSFDEQTILDVRAAAPGLRTAIIDQPPGYRAPDSVLQFGRTYLVNHVSVTRDRTEQWERAGIEVRPWTVDSSRVWRRMAWDGSGPVITNRPKTYLAWARQFCS